MALVLEKRFPDLLGDRLITAVELSDPEAAREFGYSPMLVRETIREASERVDQVPVNQVFDWRRLFRMGVLVGLLSLGLYALAAGGFCLARSLGNEGDAMAGVGDFNEVATIWTERNVLLRNTIWPRRAYLEILPFEGAVGLEGGSADPTELRIPQGTQPPPLRVRAWKYIIADGDSRRGLAAADLGRPRRSILSFSAGGESARAAGVVEAARFATRHDDRRGRVVARPVPGRRRRAAGVNRRLKWSAGRRRARTATSRPLLWKDLTKEKLAGLDVPALPAAWVGDNVPAGHRHDRRQAARRGRRACSWCRRTASSASMRSRNNWRRPTRPTPPSPPCRAVFDRLDAARGDPRRGRPRRRDGLRPRQPPASSASSSSPQEVTLVYRSNRATNTSTLTPTAGNQFSGNFAELKESVSYTVRGEDYVTARREITVVERPRVDSLESREERPAYLFYLPPTDGSPEDVRLKRQPLEASKLSVSGDTTTLEVPAGTLVVLEGQADQAARRASTSPSSRRTPRTSRARSRRSSASAASA